MTHKNTKAVRLSPSMDESQFNEVSRWLTKWGVAHEAKFPYLTLRGEFDMEVEFGDWIIFEPATDRVSLKTHEEFTQ
mgnify:CR=1 FL=1